MEKKELTCIGCPLGCALLVELSSQGDELNSTVIRVTGNTCKKGEDYAKKELTNPTRIVTSTVIVNNGKLPMVSVKTRQDIPKGKIFSCMEELKGVEVLAPIHIGDIIKKNIAGTGVDVIATKEVGCIK
jgi:CxxC motif-containing protein